MKIELKRLPHSEIELSGEIPAEKFSEYWPRALKTLGEHVEIPGFRKGSAPENILLKKIPEMKVLEEAAEMAINDAYPEIIKEHKLDPIGHSELRITKLAKGNALGFSLKTALVPGVKLPDYKKIAAGVMSKKEAVEVSEKEIDDALMEIRKFRLPAEDSAQAGAPKVEEKPGEKAPEPVLPELTDEFAQSLGLPAPRPGLFFVYAILCDNNSIYIGQTEDLRKRWGEHRDGHGALHFKSHKPIKIVHYEEFKSRDAVAQREKDLKTGFGRKWLKQEFESGRTRQAGNFKTAAELKEKIKSNMKLEKERELKDKKRVEILEKIAKESEIDLPNIIIEEEKKRLLAQMKHDLERAGLKFDDYLRNLKKTEEDLKKEWAPESEKRAKIQLILSSIAGKENITPSEEELSAEVKHLLGHQKDVDETRARLYLSSVMTNDKVLEFLEKQGAN